MKKTLSILLALVLVIGACAVVPASAARPKKKPWTQVDSMDSDFALVNQCNACKIVVDTETQAEGEGCIFFDMEDWYIRPAGVFTSMSLDLFEEAIDIDEKPIFEFLVKNNKTYVKAVDGGRALQINFIDSTVHGADGINTNNEITGIPANVWARKMINLEGREPEKIGGVPIPLDRANIDMLRISGLEYCEDYAEYDFSIDSLVFMTSDEYDARNAEEVSLSSDIMAMKEVTSANLSEFAELKARYEKDMEDHPNFLLGSYDCEFDDVKAHYNVLKNQYIKLNPEEYVQKAHDDIEAIGTLTRDNYIAKKSLILAAEADVAKLDELFGESGYTLDNKQKLIDARATFDGLYVAVTTVINDIKALPARHLLTWKNDRTEVYRVNAEFEALTADEQIEVGSDNTRTLEGDVQRMGELFIYGDLNGDEAVTSADALIALQVGTGKTTPTIVQKMAGDVNGDLVVNSADALLILQKSTGKIQKFPVEK